MNREEIITTLLSQFKENANRLSDQDLEKVAKGELVISLVQAVGEEAGGALVGAVSAAPRTTLGDKTTLSSASSSTTTATAQPAGGSQIKLRP